MLKQDLHIHTTYSHGDRAIVAEQNLETIHWLKHAEIIGISDHFEYITGKIFDTYKDDVKKYGFYCGTEVDGYKEVKKAIDYDFDYYVYHCFDRAKDYLGAVQLLKTGKPVIIAHPYALGTELSKIPSSCIVEINNRYILQSNWKEGLTPFKDKFRFVLSSDAHQPNWLNQDIALKVARELNIEETIVF